jgi:hypothetical protein
MRSFEQWLREVDALLVASIGLDHESLPDVGWWDWWDSELTPAEAIAEASREWSLDGFGFALGELYGDEVPND